MKRSGFLIGSIVTAFTGAACCLPLVSALIFGISASLVSTLHVWAPLFWGLTAISLAFAFYFTYRKSKKSCDLKKKTCSKINLRTRKIILWIVVAIDLIIILYSYL